MYGEHNIMIKWDGKRRVHLVKGRYNEKGGMNNSVERMRIRYKIIVRVAPHWLTKLPKKKHKHRLLTYNRTEDDLFVLCNIRLRLWYNIYI